ncbi:MAG: TrmH family RNA methyltransferase [Elainellaceae cyanobacterium]
MLSSLQNPLVKQLRKLHRAKERDKQNCFLIEGTHLLDEACRVGWPLLVVCHTTDWQRSYPRLWEQAIQQAQRVELVSTDVIEAIATTAHPDGVVASAGRRDQTQVNQVNGPPSLGLAVEMLQDPGNLGTIIRTAAAAAVDRVWLSEDSVDLEHPKVLRASAGQWFRLPMERRRTWYEDLERLRGQVQIVATCPNAAVSYWDIDLTQPTLILVGNEGAGLSAKAIDLANTQVSIPAAANVESLNAAIATALILYEAVRQRKLLAGEYIEGIF